MFKSRFDPLPKPAADDAIEDDGHECHPDHRATLHGLRVKKPLTRLPNNNGPDADECQGVDQGGEDAGPMRAERPLRARGLLGGLDRIPRKDEGQGIGKVVRGVGHQGQAVGQVADDGLTHNERDREEDGKPHAGIGRGGGVGMTVRRSWVLIRDHCVRPAKRG